MAHLLAAMDLLGPLELEPVFYRNRKSSRELSMRGLEGVVYWLSQHLNMMMHGQKMMAKLAMPTLHYDMDSGYMGW